MAGRIENEKLRKKGAVIVAYSIKMSLMSQETTILFGAAWL
jgi:hypothetical protein